MTPAEFLPVLEVLIFFFGIVLGVGLGWELHHLYLLWKQEQKKKANVSDSPISV